MNARLAKLVLMLCSVSLLNLSELHAQDTNDSQAPQPPGSVGRRGFPQGPGGYGGFAGRAEEGPVFDIQIENGQLSLAPLAPLANHPELTKLWAPDTKSVTASIDHLSKYLRAIDPNLNIVLSPDVGNLTIENLKLSTRTPLSIVQAVSVASGGTIIGPGAGAGIGFGAGNRGGERSLTFIANRPRTSKPSLEVFNLSGFIQTLAKDDNVRQKIDDLQGLTHSTLIDLGMTSSMDVPNFKYHPGTKLLIVIGKPEAIEVVRKIINALPGQEKQSFRQMQDLLDTTSPSDQK